MTRQLRQYQRWHRVDKNELKQQAIELQQARKAFATAQYEAAASQQA